MIYVDRALLDDHPRFSGHMEETNYSAIVTTAVLTAVSTIPLTYWIVRRGELERRVEEVLKDVSDMEEAGIKYWETPSDDDDCRRLEIAIVGKSTRLGSKIKMLDKQFYAFRFDSYAPLMIFRQSITAHPFEESGRAIDRSRQPRIQEAAIQLCEAVREAQKLL